MNAVVPVGISLKTVSGTSGSSKSSVSGEDVKNIYTDMQCLSMPLGSSPETSGLPDSLVPEMVVDEVLRDLMGFSGPCNVFQTLNVWVCS